MAETKKAAREGNPKRILLGYGLYYIDDVLVGLTRGGGQFTVEREFRKIQADGDRGTYKGRVSYEGGVPKLKVSLLEIIRDDINTIYPALSVTQNENEGMKVTGKWSIDDTDYHTVKFVGKTKEGKAVIITVSDAINLENIDWGLAEKDEVVPSVTFEGTYTDDCPEDYEPWDVQWPA